MQGRQQECAHGKNMCLEEGNLRLPSSQRLLTICCPYHRTSENAPRDDLAGSTSSDAGNLRATDTPPFPPTSQLHAFSVPTVTRQLTS